MPFGISEPPHLLTECCEKRVRKFPTWCKDADARRPTRRLRGGRNPNPSPTAQRASPTGIEATTTQQYRSLSVCLALSLVPFRPQRDCNSPARDDHPLASRGVPVILARAVTQAGWQAENLGRAAQSHRRDEPCKSPLGCTTHSW